MRAALWLAALLAAGPGMAQVSPKPGPGDPRVQTVDYDPDQVVQLQTATGYQLMIEFSPSEQIENVAVGDSGAWQVTPNKRGDHLFVKPIQAGVATNMVVVTDARRYVFELTPLYGAGSAMAYTVRFNYPVANANVVEAVVPPGPSGLYRLSGARALRPVQISEDGARTYLVWAPAQTLPAVYMIDPEGRETLANGMMRDGVLVIDMVVKRLIFRLDRQTAGAVRVPPRKLRR